MHVKIYSKENCAFCTKAKTLLKNRNIDFEEVVIGRDITREEFLEFLPTAKTVPQIFIDNVLIGGYNELYNASLTWSVVNAPGDQQTI